MTLPDKNNPYSFDEFLEWRKNFDYYRDDPFIQNVVKYFSNKEWDQIDKHTLSMSPNASFRWRDFSDEISKPENKPYIIHFDAHNHRIDRIVRPKETEIMEKEIFSEGIFSDKTSPWLKLLKMYLIYQNGEACISCPLVCTEGLIALLERFADTPELKQILKHCRDGIEGDFGVGAQYISEIQGGSDIPANLIEAVNEGNTWRLYGTKFFCSATHADYAVVTAKPKGSEDPAIFIVPSWLPGNKDKEIRNGFSIDRIKWKMGTSELTTAEIRYDGAVAYPAGPLERGVANVVGIVLTYSRLTVGLSSAAIMTRAAREAIKYSEIREAFDLKIKNFPLAVVQLKSLDKYAKRTTAGAFKLYNEFLGLDGGLRGGISTNGSDEIKKKRFDIRELIMLQKITASWDSTDVIRTAMSIFGGHGVIEDFSSLPRLYRDSAVNELWEGPRNVLLTQIYRDFTRVWDWYSPSEFIKNILSGTDVKLMDELALEMDELISYNDILTMNEKTIAICEQWDSFCHRLFHAYQDQALEEVENFKLQE